jgi:hypothetical protein
MPPLSPNAPAAAIKAFQIYGGQAIKATFNSTTGKWRKPMVSPRLAAKVRKAAIREDSVGPGKMWDPVWELENPKLPSLKAPKGHLRDRTREKRAAKIEDNLKGMDKKIAEYRAAVEGRKPVPGIETLFKRINRSRS